VSLLYSFTIPCVMVLSYFVLHAKYGRRQYMGVLMAVAGLVVVVLADIRKTKSGAFGRRTFAALTVRGVAAPGGGCQATRIGTAWRATRSSCFPRLCTPCPTS
jgi:hypothetical protein